MSDGKPPGYEVSCVLPAYNEEQCIEKAVTDALAALRSCTRRFEVVVVDDGSTDATPAILEKLCAHEPALRTVRHPANRGYGAALRTGFLYAKCDLVFYTDSDVQFDMKQIKDLLPLSEKHDIVTDFASAGTTRCCASCSPAPTTGSCGFSSGSWCGSSIARSSSTGVRSSATSRSSPTTTSSTRRSSPRLTPSDVRSRKPG